MASNDERAARMANFRTEMKEVIEFLQNKTYSQGISTNAKRMVRYRAKTHYLNANRGDQLTLRRGGRDLTVLVTEEEVNDVLHQHHGSAMGGGIVGSTAPLARSPSTTGGSVLKSTWRSL